MRSSARSWQRPSLHRWLCHAMCWGLFLAAASSLQAQTGRASSNEASPPQESTVGLAAESATTAAFVSPAAGEPLFGPAIVEVAVSGPEEITHVVLRLDGVPVAERGSPPWRFTIDVGSSGDSHRLKVLVFGLRGLLATATLDAPGIRIDEAVNLRLEQLYVTVSDRDGNRVPNLPQGLFKVFDDGAPQELITFEGGDVPFTAVLLIDGSASMTGEPFAAARRGARAFLEGMGELDEASVMVFSGQQLAGTPFSGDAEGLAAVVDGARTRGGSAIHDHLYLALRRLEQRQGRRVVILLSDGRDVHSVLEAEELQAVIRRSQAQVYWVRRTDEGGRRLHSWRPPGEHRRERRALEAATYETGGRALEVADSNQVEAAFREILRELRSQYVLGYYPPESASGVWHEVRVELARRGLKARTTAGYLAP